MQAGERFSLIRAIHATFLDSPDWSVPLVDAALSEFGADYSSDQSFTERVLERLASMTDSALVALNEHVNPRTATTEPLTSRPAQEGPWNEGTFRLFLSHTHANRVPASVIKRQLHPWGTEAFVAHDAIEATREWLDVIESALATCDSLVALLTDGFHESNWCDQEVGFAVGRGILVVPVRIAVDPYGFIGPVQAITPHGATRDARRANTTDQVFSALARHPLTRARMVDPVLKRFATSGSFDGARLAWPEVVALPAEAWTPGRLSSVRQAAVDNSQLAYGVPSDETEGRHFTEALETHLRDLGIS